jgi:hypothetical protein
LVFSLVQPRNGATAADEFNPFRRPLALDGGAALACFVRARPMPEPEPVRAVRALLCGRQFAAGMVRGVHHSGDAIMRGVDRRRDYAALAAALVASAFFVSSPAQRPKPTGAVTTRLMSSTPC